MSRLALRLGVDTFALLLATSGAVVDERRLQRGACPEGSGGLLDDVQLLQKSILHEAGPQHRGIAVMTVSRTAALWPAIGPEWIQKRLPATQDKTSVALVVGVALLMLLYLCVRLPVQRRLSWKAVELPEIGETGAVKLSKDQHQAELLEEVTNWNWNGANWQGRWAEAILRT
mmetsp:Transcript_53128/g.151549  ORF Transcript_53128/g.151549 Transcript_53128/m.151549 type:complete len:173 (-) Transcript_53128:180-698(-)